MENNLAELARCTRVKGGERRRLPRRRHSWRTLVICAFGDCFGYAFDLCVVWLAVSVFAALIIGATILCENGWMNQLLSVGPLVYVGWISYGLYLWHLPIFILVQSRHWTLPKELAVEFSLVATATVASFYLLERPLLSLKRTFQPLA